MTHHDNTIRHREAPWPKQSSQSVPGTNVLRRDPRVLDRFGETPRDDAPIGSRRRGGPWQLATVAGRSVGTFRSLDQREHMPYRMPDRAVARCALIIGLMLLDHGTVHAQVFTHHHTVVPRADAALLTGKTGWATSPNS